MINRYRCECDANLFCYFIISNQYYNEYVFVRRALYKHEHLCCNMNSIIVYQLLV